MADSLLRALGLHTTLLCYELLKRFKISSAIVIDGLRTWLAIEPFQCWEALNTKTLAEIFVGIGVDIGDGDLVRMGAKGRSELVVDWG